ncbi:hypothetical protein HDV02_002759 [Globomyces sp. JEL0801]|nr:hypothetical protein HDV02_002759 [Globomyces sp. JEL0801]
MADSDAESDEGVIYPPPDIRAICDKTADYVARNGTGFEDRIREKELHNPKFGFLNPNDPYYTYYAYHLKKLKAGKNMPKAPVQVQPIEQEQETHVPLPPPPYEYLMDLPSISKQDLEVVKLTAQFVARNGSHFMATLGQREARNYQFDFLRPSHSLYPFFTRLIDQYTRVLIPPRDLFDKLTLNHEDRFQVLDRIKERVDFEAYVVHEKEKAQKDADEEKIAFATIDWHDFVVVETIEFNESDDKSILPPPMTVMELESMTLEQRKALLNFDNPAETGADDMEMDDEVDMDADSDMEMGSDEENEKPVVKNDVKVTKTEEIAPPANIRTNYVPKVGRHTTQGTQICPRCKQSIKVSEMAEHMRIELLDPKWREQKQALEARQQDSNLVKDDVLVQNLARMSSKRADLFGGARAEFAPTETKKVDPKKVIWDGHQSSVAKVTAKAGMIPHPPRGPAAPAFGPTLTKQPPPPAFQPPPPGFQPPPPPPPGFQPPPPGFQPPPPGFQPPPPGFQPPPPGFQPPPPGFQPPPPPPPGFQPPPPPDRNLKRQKLDPNALSITIQTPAGENLDIPDLTPLWTVAQLKDRLTSLVHIPVSKQKLSTTTGTVLRNALNLGSCGIRSGDYLILNLKK